MDVQLDGYTITFVRKQTVKTKYGTKEVSNNNFSQICYTTYYPKMIHYDNY